MVGKASSIFKKGGVIGFKKDEFHVSVPTIMLTHVIEPDLQIDKYEILVGDSRAVRWVPCSGNFNVGGLRAQPVEGGREPDGTPIYIAQAPYHGGVHPGKACEIYGDGCFIPYDDSEKKVKVRFDPRLSRTCFSLVYFCRNTLFYAMPEMIVR